MIHIDSKITIWDRFSIDDEHKDDLLEFLDGNPEATTADIIEWAEAHDISGEHDTLHDTGEDMTVEENGGNATIEVSDMQGYSSGLTIWTNAPKEPTTTTHYASEKENG
jgi:hypothetical protein